MKIITGLQDTRNNKEDFVLTPYLFTVYVRVNSSKVYGIGICLFYYAVYIGFGINIPKSIPFFRYKPYHKTSK